MSQPPENSVQPETPAEWRAWLQTHHSTSPGIWLIIHKKASGKQRLDYGEAVEEALAFGWIDSKPRTLDNQRSMRWFTPRKAGSGWSRLNKQRIERLIADGRMAPPGLARIEAARMDGSWEALDAIEAMVIPEDLARAFAANPLACDNFNAFPRTAKRVILEWISNARRPETRAKRVAEAVEKAARNIRANEWRPTK